MEIKHHALLGTSGQLSGYVVYKKQTRFLPSTVVPGPQKYAKIMAFNGYYWGFKAIILDTFGV